MRKKIYISVFFTLFAISFFIIWFISLSKNLFDAFILGDASKFNHYYSKISFVLDKDLQNTIETMLGNKKYIIIFQNNMELRPTGGFIGSYASIEIKDSVLGGTHIKDIYIPDGQIEGHIDPPIPIQQAFQTGDFRLPNANWYPDFPKSAETLRWYFEKGKEPNIDSVVAVNLSLVQEMLKITGSVKPYDFPESVDANNFYQVIQSYAEDDFFPGSIKKQSYLTGLGISLITKVNEMGFVDKLKLVLLLKKQLNERQILVWYQNQDLEKYIINKGYGGDLGSYKFDYTYFVESNLGANKANLFVERKIKKNVFIQDNKIHTINEIDIKNNFDPDKEYSKWGGIYINYQRVIVPQNAMEIKVEIGNIEYTTSVIKDYLNAPNPQDDKTYTIENYQNYKIIGFWLIAEKNSSIKAKLSYSLPNKTNYTLLLKRQPGITSFPFTLTFNDQEIVNTNILKDTEFQIEF